MKFSLIAILATILVGCSGNPARDDAIVGITVQYGVAKYVEAHPGSEANIVRIATDLKALASGSASLLTLQEVVHEEIDKLRLSPADMVLASSLVDLVVGELQVKVGEGVLSPEQQVEVVRFLDLIIATAS